jgi:hypothetical protein
MHFIRRRLVNLTQISLKVNLYFCFILIVLVGLKLYSSGVMQTDMKVDRENWTNITEEYVAKYKRGVPVNFDKWVEFAIRGGCSLDLGDYEQINLDLRPFRKPNEPKTKTINNKLLIKEANRIPRMSRIVLHNGHLNLMYLGNDRDFWSLLLADVVAKILPKKSITMIVNDRFDEPKVLSPNENIDLVRNVSKFKFYTSIQEALAESECLRSKFNHVIPHHGFLNSPDSFLVTTKLVPVFSPCKLECFSDLLLPFHMIKPVEEFFAEENQSVPDTWSSRSSRVVWRGATTGSDITSTNGFEKYSHRFKLVQWAMSANRSKKLDIDIGFYSISNAHSIKTKKHIWKVYGKKSFLSRDDQFKSKYAIMVDGNTWYFA